MTITGPSGIPWINNGAETTPGTYLCAAVAQDSLGSAAGYGSVAFTGPVHVTLTWSGSDPLDLPPATVILQKNATVSWTGDAGSCGNGLGDTVMSNPSGASCTGTTYEAHPGDQTISFDWSPTATGSLSPGSASSARLARASATLTVSVLQPKISLLGGYNNGSEYLVGQRCTANIQGINPLSINSIDWAVTGGEPFKSFSVTPMSPSLHCSGIVTLLSPSDYHNPTFACNFAKVESSISITATIHVNVPSGSKPISGVNLSLNVDTSTTSPTVETPSVKPGQVHIGSPTNHDGATVNLIDADGTVLNAKGIR